MTIYGYLKLFLVIFGYLTLDLFLIILSYFWLI
jgi:hypothetical protein